eukprot:CAMPEP_0113455580 /NCGR_PEP_ID=MMETSP0014_2-20120614/8448_1 /TAXON_ID=2857 /ORGANISM="Nitzschia sp." /LENGTH=1213 /DNA_ID=CAMNT_0000347013 /DNA_START=398 /DNA_END=4036 /DNA_ORIENTATION=+ /assembly_acc=CAM_ASM_000159
MVIKSIKEKFSDEDSQVSHLSHPEDAGEDNNSNDEDDAKAQFAAATASVNGGSSTGGDGGTVATGTSANTAAAYATFCGVKRSRVLIVFAILAVGGIVGGLAYYFTSRNEQQNFEAEATSHALVIEETILHKTKTEMSVMETMAVTVQTYARTTTDTSWPYETVPHFESVAHNFMHVTNTRLIALAPVVVGGGDSKSQWESYSVANQDWIEHSYEDLGWESIEQVDIPNKVYDVDPTTGHHYYPLNDETVMPVWQVASAPKDTGIVNYNLLSNPSVARTASLVSDCHMLRMTQLLDVSEVLGGDEITTPESLMIQPILAETAGSSAYGEQVVANLVAAFSWDLYLSNLYHAEENVMIAVVHPSCVGADEDQTFSYQLNGPEAIYLGRGDVHDPKYDDIAVVVTPSNVGMEDIMATDMNRKLEENAPDMSNQEGSCEYIIYLYPHVTFEDSATSNAPAIYTAVVVLMFFILAMVFMMYDIGATRRQQQIQKEASRSSAIVNSLFPAEIRDRLLEEEENAQQLKKAKKEHTNNGATAQKYRLKNFIDDENEAIAANNKGKDLEAADDTIQESKPIADLFPHATVFFADIAGFTAWSSVREPSQVFTLLETIYKSFDKSAKKRKVFKVETVGDCYVAVTGLPEPNADHPIVMCKFARECLTQFNKLSTQLEVILGPDTGDLQLRVGIHSGPVTAGVLRGDKSRFQLFGDTVNTAARIESSSMGDKIHISHETAELLHKAGKSSWLRRRTDTVLAKGKGEMQTYWLVTDEEIASGALLDGGAKAAAPLPVVNAMASRVAKSDVLDPEAMLPPRIKRLVDWNVDVLKRLLKQIVARRNALEMETYHPNHPSMMKLEMNIGSDTYVLNEVVDTVKLPPYQKLKDMENPNKIELPEGAEAQLRLYVSSIAALHRDNAFHNFEHASHVMMSVSKLLSRIVAPDEILQGEDEDDQIQSDLHDHTYGITSDPLTQFSVVMAALVHDCDHSGVSNFQLIKENAKIASVFKNKSVAEQNSVVLAWDRLMESRFTALRSCIYGDPEEMKRFRQLMVNTVLATDIFDKELMALRKDRWEKAFRAIDDVAREDSSREDDINRKATIVIEHLIQASDVAHTMQHWHIYQKWNERLFAEMTSAYQNGRMDKNPADGWYNGELWFFDNYIIPLAKKLKECGVFGVSSDEYLNYALENRREWQSKGEEAVKRMIEKYSKPEDNKEEEKSGEA